MRLDKAVALAGLTRRDARKAIADGRVKVNGETATDAGQNVTARDSVEVNGQAVSLKEHVHIMLNKPADVLTATEDARGERTVADLLPEALRLRRIGPVGRLDKDVTGLILMTTDGQLAHRLISPRREIEKRYLARCEGMLDEDCQAAFARGIEFKEFTALPARLEILSATAEESLARVYVKEGKFHQVKRMLKAVGHPVIALKREKIGPITLDETLSEGQWRELTEAEEAALYQVSGMVDP